MQSNMLIRMPGHSAGIKANSTLIILSEHRPKSRISVEIYLKAIV